MDRELEKKIRTILDKLPAVGETKYPGMTYEQGIEEALMYLLGELDDADFDYADNRN